MLERKALPVEPRSPLRARGRTHSPRDKATLGEAIFLRGDVLAAINKIQPKSCDLIISSPPYNIGKDYERDDNLTFKEDAGKRFTISMDMDMLLRAEDTEGAYGANTVTCKTDQFKAFDVSKLSVGPRPNTVVVEADYADAAIIKTACGKGFPKPEDAIGELPPGDAYVPEGRAKSGKLVVDLVTRKVAPR